ncbi:MAG: galactitol-1-phosphate 5-dehydrogenase [Butyrivibrio sp.]|nr:galactitol-1-phosphate 5-dehydrogenase [Butyrivibrio sp.]
MAKAWVLHDIGDIRFEDVEVPVPGEKEVLVKVKAVGICGSDIPRIYETGAHKMPLIPGHEFSGVIEKVGVGVSGDLAGKRVAVFPKIPCGKCERCQKGEHDLCLNYDYSGSRRDGAFAEYVSVPASNVMELPSEVSFEEGAMTEPLAVAANAVRTGCAGLDANDSNTKIAVCGMGTIGLMVVMLLKGMGFSNVYVIGNKDSHPAKALDLGIDSLHYCDVRSDDPVAWLKQNTGGVSVYFECVGSNDSIRYGLEAGAPKGKLVFVGNPKSDMYFSRDTYWEILRKQLHIIGIWNSTYREEGADITTVQAGANIDCSCPSSTAGVLDDWHYVRDLLSAGKIHPAKLISHKLPLADLDKGLYIMRDKTEDYCKIMICP